MAILLATIFYPYCLVLVGRQVRVALYDRDVDRKAHSLLVARNLCVTKNM